MSVTTSAGPATEEDRLARATISLVAEPGDVRCLGLTRELGGAAFLDVLRTHPDLRPQLAAAAARLAEVEPGRVLERAERHGIRFVIPDDDEWPTQLDDLGHAGALNERGEAPVGLWVKGPGRLDTVSDSVAIVGARSSTTYGDQVAADIAAVVGQSGRAVISGAAFGIDYAAHRGAVSADGPTVAVLACGVDRAYPAAHRAMLDHLGEHHAIVSESPPGAAPFRVRFLARNRLIAALASGTVVVEAAIRSGALNTAGWAERMNRVVMGTPGPLTSVASEGVHQLIRAGSAMLVTGGGDVLELLGAPGEHLVEVPRAPEKARDHLTVKAQQVLDAVPVHNPAQSESIAEAAGVGVMEADEVLIELREAGLIELLPVGWRLSEHGRR